MNHKIDVINEQSKERDILREQEVERLQDEQQQIKDAKEADAEMIEKITGKLVEEQEKLR